MPIFDHEAYKFSSFYYFPKRFSMTDSNVKNFYNHFVNYQTKSGLNERIFSLYRRLVGMGLRSSTKILELGCGIGTLTFLLSKKVKTGYIESVDISDESIRHAQSKISNSNIHFSVADIVHYIPKGEQFDFILLFDILEHIPLDLHGELFQNLSNICSKHTKILINIPNPEYIFYDQQYNPTVLQVIDQAIPLRAFVENTEKFGLTITLFETYSIWVKKDYQFLVLEKKTEFQEEKLSHERSILQKIQHRLKQYFITWRYKYN
jgi:trans-aconitate 2-methyltransferase